MTMDRPIERWLLPSDVGIEAEKARIAAWHATYNAALAGGAIPSRAESVATQTHGWIHRWRGREYGVYEFIVPESA